jgi:glycosyltransferase involved in cell wall biosynthesis
MRIVLDIQASQGENKDRGIGRYSTSLAKAIAKVANTNEHEVFLFLNAAFPDTIPLIRKEFKGLISNDRFFIFNPPSSVCGANHNNCWRMRAAEIIREHALFRIKPDIVHTMSLFEGFGDEAVSSMGILKNIPTSFTLHDLIPFTHSETYLADIHYKNWYYRKLQHIKNAYIILANSEYTKQEAVDFIGVKEDLIVNISEGIDESFRPIVNMPEDEKIEIFRRYKIVKDFVMYTGGINPRKNMEGLIRAYAGLPKETLKEYQLVIVCSIAPDERRNLEYLAKSYGLKTDDIVLTGFANDADLAILYNLCKVFVFPSLYEGFGLPPLEAMACGAAVIGSNTTSIPEVIGKDDALFDPYSEKSISSKIYQTLTDDLFRKNLKEHGLKQAKKFSWDRSAKLAIAIFEDLHRRLKENKKTISCSPAYNYKPKLAYISPLPPERSGISDYSAELLPELSKYYEIEVIVRQKDVSDSWIMANYPVRSIDWFYTHANMYDRVLYHFGNSEFHMHMFELLSKIPGVVILHDFFLSGVLAHMEINGYTPNIWVKELLYSHGYKAVYERFHATDTADIVFKYPCNLSVLQQAKGVIVHSDYSCKLADKFYGKNVSDDWHAIPLMRFPSCNLDRNAARKKLGFSDEDFVICSFGIMGKTKLNHRLLDAFISLTREVNKQFRLIFVGKNDEGTYGKNILETIRKSGVSERIKITGWTEFNEFRTYLSATDIAVQLRAFSRGETSAAVLDCMNYGLPTIVNASGFMEELPVDGVVMLPDEFSDDELIKSLENLRKDPLKRGELSKNASGYIRQFHFPQKCAEQYAETIEQIYRSPDRHTLIRALAKETEIPDGKENLQDIVRSIAASVRVKPARRQLFVDVSELVQRDSKSGIQRVVKGVLNELLKDPPLGYYVEPVYAGMEHGYRYARQFTMKFLDCPGDILSDEPIDYGAGDVFLGLDLQPHIVPRHKDFYMELRRRGAGVFFMVHDLLPVLMPQYFLPEADIIFGKWLDAVSAADGAVCVSRATAESLAEWMKANRPDAAENFKIVWNHNGYDTGASAIPGGMPQGSAAVLAALSSRYSFLTVGTLEPRKGHLQTLKAFELLWKEGISANLVIVGKQGWMAEGITKMIGTHAELNNRLFRLEGISDEYLERIYGESACLIAASEGEGFGLPLIEAARHGLPVIARDIPVFREVAGTHAFYFSGLGPEELAQGIKRWISLYKEGRHPKSNDMPRLTWKESVRGLLKIILPQ